MKAMICMAMAAGLLAAGQTMAAARTYDDLGGVDTSDTSFWNVSGHAGVSVEEATADVADMELRSRTETHTASLLVHTTKICSLVILLK